MNKKAIHGAYLSPLELGEIFLSIEAMVAKEKNRFGWINNKTFLPEIWKFNLDKIQYKQNIDKGGKHKQVVLREDKHMII